MGANGEDFDNADVLTPARLAQKTVKVDTTANITGETTYGGMVVVPTTTSGAFTTDYPRLRDTANSAWNDIALANKTQTISGTWTLSSFSGTLNNTLDAANNLIDNPLLRNAKFYQTNRWPFFITKEMTTTETNTGSATTGNTAQFREFNTGATNGSISRFHQLSATQGISVRRDRRFEIIGVMTTPSVLTTVEFEFGVSDTDSAALSAAGQTHVSIVYDSATSANWICRNANGTTQTSTTTGTAVATSTRYQFAIISDETDLKFYLDGTLLATHTTNLPGGTTNMGARAYIKNTAAATRVLYRGHWAIWSDAT